MIIFPAIDIKDGKCVRLMQGDLEKEEVFYDDPASAAAMWESMGAEYIHVVDLDGAFNGKITNNDVVARIIKSINIPIQIGGGIRNISDIEYFFDLGADRVILGTAALFDKELIEKALKSFGDKIAVSIDAKNGYAASNGWARISNINSLDLAKELEKSGLKYLIYTDILKDGMLSGPNFKQISILQRETNLKIIASGGISSEEDIYKLKELGVYGAIVGKALYTGKIKDLGGIIFACKENYSLS
ncbi:1-(5-phosphoribosyl)-5-[(5-phosphoribosylamino)methylideneamino] imidazole-4-carboxamide isomerase [Caloramator quimbayensis]|uniref:1-(5-phosphoribosyl)-5-[(5-phosphoribosylamino)methylideneamino] imidazole-4-carboxamide isomerase n=1 Tax=Caloramator quimbayensis TaxID=1147123 RepID=A0A1T4X5S1_9CLOT|nr:1-(5-phosphoribosyl)-5-[(5-phosphoribosylamino)methylideneamino]imidazole-4-carboxamide isomerase [Caloramator quimbayensis]SKA84964.1 1-(5-phosphoribosyl)-5-[(5-phosphoribosylamino)methylideneamino] imidazole-4-carboxamide isomerase [Caloramator quimbayensis]